MKLEAGEAGVRGGLERQDEKLDRGSRFKSRSIYTSLLDPAICVPYGHKTTHKRQCMTERGKRCTESSGIFPFARVIEITASQTWNIALGWLKLCAFLPIPGQYLRQ